MLIKTLLLALLMTCPALGFQTDQDKEKPKPKWHPPEIEKSADVDDSTAKAAIAAFDKAIRGAKEISDKKYAMDDLAKSRHKKVGAVFAKILLRDREPALRSHAADCLSRLALPDSESSLLKAFSARINKEDDDVLEAVGRALGQVGEKSLFPKLGKDFEDLGKGGKSGLVLLFGYRKDAAALKILSKWLDEPRPRNPDDPNNPPASYWKQRFAEYHYIHDEVVWAMWRITGEVLHTEDEYNAWLDKKKSEEKSGRQGMGRRR